MKNDIYNKLLNNAGFKNQREADEALSDLEGVDFKAVMNSPFKTKEDLIRLIQIVYAWMPKMITPFYRIKEIKEFDFEKLFINAKKIKNGINTIDEETDFLQQLSKLTNNRIVGTSKVMMVLNKDKYPIFDSRVILAWNILFPKSRFRNISTLENPQKAIENYRDYKNKVNEIAALNKMKIRQVEFLFYTYGKKLNEKA